MLKPVDWIGSSKADLKKFPATVQDAIGFALYQAQNGVKHRDTKPLKGSANLLEIVLHRAGDTYRTVYTFGFEAAVYVLYALQEKRQRGRATPTQERDPVEAG